MTHALLALVFWLQLALMLALVGEDPRQLSMQARIRIALAAALVAGTEAWCSSRPLGSPWRIVPLVPAAWASYAVYRGAAAYRDARGATSYLLALCSALVLREFSLSADMLANGLGCALAAVLPFAAMVAWQRFGRERYLALQVKMPSGWQPTCTVCAALTVLVYLLACVPSPVQTRPEDYPQVLLAAVLAPLVQTSMLVTVSGHFDLLQARERERVLRLSAERMAEAVQQAAENDRLLAIRRHDLRHHMATIDELVATGQTERARAYVRSLAEGRLS